MSPFNSLLLWGLLADLLWGLLGNLLWGLLDDLLWGFLDNLLHLWGGGFLWWGNFLNCNFGYNRERVIVSKDSIYFHRQIIYTPTHQFIYLLSLFTRVNPQILFHYTKAGGIH